MFLLHNTVVVSVAHTALGDLINMRPMQRTVSLGIIMLNSTRDGCVCLSALHLPAKGQRG